MRKVPHLDLLFFLLSSMSPLQVCVERVVEEGCALEDVGVVLPDVSEPLADRPEAGRLSCDLHFGGEICPVHDLPHPLESGVSWESLLDQCLEGAASPF